MAIPSLSGPAASPSPSISALQVANNVALGKEPLSAQSGRKVAGVSSRHSTTGEATATKNVFNGNPPAVAGNSRNTETFNQKIIGNVNGQI